MESAPAHIRAALLRAGATAVGFAQAGPVDDGARVAFEHWLSRGDAGELDYMHRNLELRLDPRGLLEGCATIISTAWLYNPPRLRSPKLHYLARYAYCRDYHKALRSVLKPVMRELAERWGFEWRICIDSAPVMERYWAVKSGIGFCGRNAQLIVPGVGSRVFLVEILITLPLPPDTPCTESCGECLRCVRACPTQALEGHSPDCRRCLSALTIEVPGSAKWLPRATLAGCDVCQDVCPHNAASPVTTLPALQPLPQLLTVDREELQSLTDESFRTRYAGTPLMRIGRAGLLKNFMTPT